jgi:hypothetical protein
MPQTFYDQGNKNRIISDNPIVWLAGAQAPYTPPDLNVRCVLASGMRHSSAEPPSKQILIKLNLSSSFDSSISVLFCEQKTSDRNLIPSQQGGIGIQ